MAGQYLAAVSIDYTTWPSGQYLCDKMAECIGISKGDLLTRTTAKEHTKPDQTAL